MQSLKITFTLTLLSFFVVGCEQTFIEPPSNDAEAIFDNLWNTFNEEYAPFEEREIDWLAEYNTFRPMVTSNTTDDQLFSVLSQLLAKLNDGHVSLTAPGKDVFYSNKIRRELIDDEII